MTDTPPDRVEAPPGPPCRHLRHAGMYVHTDVDPTDPRGGGEGTTYWCLRTHKGFGPDDGLVDGVDCRDPARTCHDPA